MKASQSIHNLKEKIFESMNLSIESQKIIYKKDEETNPIQLHFEFFWQFTIGQLFIFQL